MVIEIVMRMVMVMGTLVVVEVVEAIIILSKCAFCERS